MRTTAALTAAIDELSPRAVDLLSRLVREPSTVGQESRAQEVLAADLEALGFATSRLPIPDTIGEHPAAGVPLAGYDQRHDLVARRGRGARSLLLNGHIDVVPAADAGRWTSPPFELTQRAGWLVGRGAGD